MKRFHNNVFVRFPRTSAGSPDRSAGAFSGPYRRPSAVLREQMIEVLAWIFALAILGGLGYLLTHWSEVWAFLVAGAPWTRSWTG